jgi:hypothetical protein
MTTVQIHEALDAMLENPKTKNFLGHLVKNYFPTTSVSKVMEKPSGSFKCVITGDNLLSMEELMTTFNSEEYKNTLSESFKNLFNENFNTKNKLKDLIGDKKIGVTGSETTTYMGYDTLREFYNWVLKKSIENDKHINWFLGANRNNPYGVKKSIEPQKSMGTTYSLGDVASFKSLIEKFNK